MQTTCKIVSAINADEIFMVAVLLCGRTLSLLLIASGILLMIFMREHTIRGDSSRVRVFDLSSSRGTVILT